MSGRNLPTQQSGRTPSAAQFVYAAPVRYDALPTPPTSTPSMYYSAPPLASVPSASAMPVPPTHAPVMQPMAPSFDAFGPAVTTPSFDPQRDEWKRQQEERWRKEQAARAEVVRQEAMKAEAARQEAARLDAMRIEAARAEAARLEAIKMEAVKKEAARVEALRVEALRQEEQAFKARMEEQRRKEMEEAARIEKARQEAMKIEAARQEAMRLEALRQEALRQEALRLEQMKQEAVREAARQEALRVEALRQEAMRVEALRLEALRVEAARQEAIRIEGLRQEALRQEALRLEAMRVEAARLEAARIEALKAEAARQEKRRVEETEFKRQMEEARKREVAEQRRKEEEERAHVKRLEEERRKREEEERLRLEALMRAQMEAARKVEEERRRKEEEDKARADAVRKAEEAAFRAQMEAQRKAEEERRKKEEDDRARAEAVRKAEEAAFRAQMEAERRAEEVRAVEFERRVAEQWEELVRTEKARIAAMEEKKREAETQRLKEEEERRRVWEEAQRKQREDAEKARAAAHERFLAEEKRRRAAEAAQAAERVRLAALKEKEEAEFKARMEAQKKAEEEALRARMEIAAKVEKEEAMRKEELVKKQAEMKRDLERKLAAQEEAWRKEAEGRFAREAAEFKAREAAEAQQQRDFEATWTRQETERLRLEEERRVLQLEELKRKEETARAALATQEMQKKVEGLRWRQEAEERFKEEEERKLREREEKRKRDEVLTHQAQHHTNSAPLGTSPATPSRLTPPPIIHRTRDVKAAAQARASVAPNQAMMMVAKVNAADPPVPLSGSGHVRRRSLDAMLRCPVCDSVFDTQAALGAHVDESHPPTPIVARANANTASPNTVSTSNQAGANLANHPRVTTAMAQMAHVIATAPQPRRHAPDDSRLASAAKLAPLVGKMKPLPVPPSHALPPTPRSRGGSGPNSTVIHCQAILRGFLARRRYRRETMRARVVRELLSTEQAYVQGLGRVIEVILKPLRAKAMEGGKSMLSLADVNTLFGNIEEIHRLAVSFLPTLQEVIGKWSVFCVALADVVGRGTGSETFIAAYCQYSKHFDSALGVLEAVSKQSGFKAFVKIYERDLEGKDVGAHLILPIQRPPRYVLLLKELLKHSRPYHPDYARLQALEIQLAELCRRMNDSRKDNEDIKLRAANTRRVLETLDSRPKELSDTSVYVREGALQLWDLDAAKRVDRVFYLFKDHLIVTEARKGKKSKVKVTVDLSTARVESLQDGACTYLVMSSSDLAIPAFLGQVCQNAFLVHTPRISFLFYSASADEKRIVVNDLSDAIHETRAHS